MLFCLGVSVLFCHAKIYDVDDIGHFGARTADEEIVWFDVAVDQVLLVNSLHARQLQSRVSPRFQALCAFLPHHLLRNHDNRFDAEPPIAVIEEILE